MTPTFTTSPVFTPARFRSFGQTSAERIETVQLGATRYRITVRQQGAEGPVCLWISDGPHGPAPLCGSAGDLGPHRLVSLDLGSRKAMTPSPPESDPVETWLTELIALIHGLRERWQQDKIVLLAHSRASLLGLLAVARDPDLFFAYAGVSQLIHPARNDRMVYDIALQGARQYRHGRIYRRLEAMGPPPYLETDVACDRTLFSLISRYCPQKRLRDRVNGLIPGRRTRRARRYERPRGLEPIYSRLADLDLSRSAIRIQVPLMLLTGRYDCISMPYLAQHYFNRVQAPRKTFVWFERSGHDPHLQEPQKGARMLKQFVLDTVPQ